MMDFLHIRMQGWIIYGQYGAVRQICMVDNGRCVAIRSMQYLLDAFLNDIHMQQSQKPHRNPKPSACEVSASNCKRASFSCSFSKASRKSLLTGIMGYSPQYTIGFISRYPCSGSVAA